MKKLLRRLLKAFPGKSLTKSASGKISDSLNSPMIEWYDKQIMQARAVKNAASLWFQCRRIYEITVQEPGGVPLRIVVDYPNDHGRVITQDLFNYAFAKEQYLMQAKDEYIIQSIAVVPDGSEIGDFGE